MSRLLKYKKLVLTCLAIPIITLLLRYSPAQEKIMFPSWSPVAMGNEVKSIEYFQTKDQIKLSFKQCKTYKHKKALLYFLGNGESITKYTMNQLHQLSQNFGANIYMFDYRGYGLSKGVIKNDKQLYEDANAFFEHVKNIGGYKDEDMFVLGRSLGGAFAIDIASRHKIGGLIICYTFTSMYQVVREKITTPLAWLLVRYTLDSLSRMQQVKCAVLACHGKQDKVIGFHHGKNLKSAYTQDAGKYEFIQYSGSHMQDPSSFSRKVRNFISTNS